MPLRRIKPRGGDEKKEKEKRREREKKKRKKEREEPQSGLVVAFKRSSVSKKGHKENGSAGEGNWKMTRDERSGCIGESEMQQGMGECATRMGEGESESRE